MTCFNCLKRQFSLAWIVFFPCFAKKVKCYDRVAGVAVTLIHSFSISVRSESAVWSEWFGVKTWPFLTICSADRLLWTRQSTKTWSQTLDNCVPFTDKAKLCQSLFFESFRMPPAKTIKFASIFASFIITFQLYFSCHSMTLNGKYLNVVQSFFLKFSLLVISELILVKKENYLLIICLLELN